MSLKTVREALEVLEKSLNFTHTCLYEPWSKMAARTKYRSMIEILKSFLLDLYINKCTFFQTLVGVDVDKPDQMALRAEFNITGFPTLYYFQ